AAAGTVPRRVPPGGLGIVQIEQDGLDLLDLAGLHREELGHETVEGGDGARGFDRAVEPPETQDGQNDPALLIDDGVAAIPEITSDEAAAVEPFGGDGISAVAVVAGELGAVLETPRVRQ